MSKKKFTLLCVVIFISLLCSCGIKTEGNTLYAFTERLNILYPEHTISQSGFIYDETKQTISKFFTTDNREILVQFELNEKSELKKMNLAFENLDHSSVSEEDFIILCINAFINNKETTNDILEKIKLTQILYTPSYETRAQKSGDVDLYIDVTAVGTVITVVKNNL